MCFALFAWFAWAALLAGVAKTATGKAGNEWQTLGQLGLVCECSDTNVAFLILVVRNNKRSSGIDRKNQRCLSRNCLYYRYLELS